MLAVVIGMVGVLTTVSRGIDDHQRKRESDVVSLRLTRVLEIVGEDLNPTTVWDEAVAEMAAPTDPTWFDRFMGGLYTTRHGHHATLGYDSSGRLIRASHHDAAPDAEAAVPFVRAARPLVNQLRAEAQGRHRSTHAKGAVRFKSAFIDIDGVIYVVGVSTIVRHTPGGLVPDADPMVASFKSFDSELDWLRNRLGAAGARFQPGAGPPPEGMSGVPILDAAGARLGQIVWTPQRPGQKILTQALPLVILILALLAVGGGVLVSRMVADVRRLGDSEAALSVALERAEAANAAKTRFLSNVSHELRTPLNGVLGMAEVMSMDMLAPKQRERLDILKASGQRQLRLIEDLLDVVRLGDGEVKLVERPFRPETLLRRLTSDYRGAAGAKGLVLTVEAVVRGEWLGDAVHLEKVMAALVHNAIRFTDSGEVIMRVMERDGLVFEVQDTGPGMDKAESARLFDPFAQRDESSTRIAEGLGLGLTVANGLAQLMGGRIEVDSTPGVGSLFRVVLPLEPAVRSSEAEAA
ncbi:MAG: HAMP domain-containing sensor histidine kinase [Brevundimonas sp.]|uniref:sensor histidine kinase n=1 Tax=Brevundimonas sp. TaxID=1871086 RepID=UPI00271B871F|nr:HAMP domain-containing sensor histidine kinase [Brevundimonas sp.]MDO9609855.1 HAMP domain-containing sensor histidine kinase [Brevundimonas sp.]